jgi:porphobilinogen synthase
MSYPRNRPRRLRRTGALRTLVRETDLAPRHLVAPLFVKEGIEDPAPIPSMPGQYQHTVESLRKAARAIAAQGVVAFVLHALRDEMGDEHVLIADLCLDEYTDHGHCGVLAPDGSVDNDATVDRYRRIAVAQAEAGADLVAPSGMMDGQVAAIRGALDDAGYATTGILAYAAKFASAFYGPFRDAAECAPRFGDRAAYQVDPANGDEAMREIRTDLDEGADMVMIKPALPYLDVIRRARESFDEPIAAYNVSGEYAMLKAAAERGWLDERRAILEVLTSIRRAGADQILTYHAAEAAGWLT